MTKTILTHGGAYHADEIFAVAVLLIYLKGDAIIVRTRDESQFAVADYVVDIGGVLDPAGGRFDHHQKGGAGAHTNTIPYASFGLLWKQFGLELCQGNESVANSIETRLVSGIDAHDNGISIETNLYKDIYPYSIGHFFGSFFPSFNGEKADYDNAFQTCVNLAKGILEREIAKGLERVTLEREVDEIYQKSEDKRVIIMDQKYPWEGVLQRYSEPLFAVYPNKENDNWTAKAVPSDSNVMFSVRKQFPESWAGKRSRELVEITDVPDAIFCHNARFIAVAKTKEGILKLVELALQA